MLKEIKINKMIQIDDKDYFVLSIYFIDTRILLDMVTESEDRINSSRDFKIPRTLEEDLLSNFKREKNRRRGSFELLVNGKAHKSIGGSQRNYDENFIKVNVEFPEEFKGKQLDFIKDEFQQLEEKIEIEEVALVKKVSSKECLIRKQNTVPIHIGSNPFVFEYKDEDTNKDESIIIRKLFFEDIDEDRRSLFACKDNEKMLCGIISANENIRSLGIYTKNRLEAGINYTMAPMIGIKKTQNPENEKLIDHELYIGFIDSKAKEVDIVLFNIHKKINDVYKSVLYEK